MGCGFIRTMLYYCLVLLHIIGNEQKDVFPSKLTAIHIVLRHHHCRKEQIIYVWNKEKWTICSCATSTNSTLASSHEISIVSLLITWLLPTSQGDRKNKSACSPDPYIIVNLLITWFPFTSQGIGKNNCICYVCYRIC